jgi:protein involved in polysaccharide export with SLBB domain
MEKKYFKKLLITLLFFTKLFSQFSSSDIERLSSPQLDQLRDALQENTNESITTADNVEPTPLQTIYIESSPDEDASSYFGYDYFLRDINFFDNIPTPPDFKLGAGDEIILSLWGETNLRESFTLNKDGMIYYSNIGFINLSNKNLKEAELLLTNELSKIYSTLSGNNNSTKLMVELGRLRSINVYFTGQIVTPGINLIHPFSDAFSAIVQAGGIIENGSLRKIQIIRHNKIIANIDFYEFFVNGNNSFSSIRLLDGDIIHIPVVSKRNLIDGEIVNPGYYELLESESLLDLVNYAGGLTSNASDELIFKDISPIKMRKSNDLATVSFTINHSNLSGIVSNNGASLSVLSISENETDIIIYGRVKRPGEYPLLKEIITKDNKKILKESSLKDILDLAGGFDDPIFSKTIDKNLVILRLSENDFYGEEFNINYDDADEFQLAINDRIFVYENPNYYNDLFYTVRGEVNKPGTYPLREGMTLENALKMSNNLTEIGSINSITVSKTFESYNQQGELTEQNELVGNIDLDYEIGDKDIITILPRTNVVRIDGNVYNEGFVSVSKNGMLMSKAIELAGGYMPYSLKKSAYVLRANGEIEKANIFRGRAKRVYPGDSVFVPRDPNPSDFEITAFISDLSTTLANIAAILILVDNQN